MQEHQHVWQKESFPGNGIVKGSPDVRSSQRLWMFFEEKPCQLSLE